MPYCEESLVAKLDPEGASQFLSAQPCLKEDTTLSHESADFISDMGTSRDSTKDCSSGTSASKIPTEVTSVKSDSVSDKMSESPVDPDNVQKVNVLLLKCLYPCHKGRVHLKVTLSLLSRLKQLNLVNLTLLLFR